MIDFTSPLLNLGCPVFILFITAFRFFDALGRLVLERKLQLLFYDELGKLAWATPDQYIGKRMLRIFADTLKFVRESINNQLEPCLQSSVFIMDTSFNRIYGRGRGGFGYALPLHLRHTGYNVPSILPT
jgi:hypothetical protein